MNTSGDDSRIGLILNGRYRITERLAEGGMGVVYKGERVQLGRPVAIKFLHEPLTKDHQFRARFEREARAMSQLSHPNCISVIDFGVEDAPYIVMDYVTGKTLRQLMDEGRVPAGRAMHISRQLLASLAHAHKHGIIHRDIKPANVMLSEATGMGDHVRIFDFGLAKLLDTSADKDLSRTNIVVGTPNYMSPEQSVGNRVDLRSDLYSTAVVIFELLTSRKPFVDENAYKVVQMHREIPPPSLAMASGGVEFSRELEAAIAKALEKEPDQRFQSAAAFAEALFSAPEARLSPMTVDSEPGDDFRAPPANERPGEKIDFAETKEMETLDDGHFSDFRSDISDRSSSRLSGSKNTPSVFMPLVGGSFRRAKLVAVVLPVVLILVAVGIWYAMRNSPEILGGDVSGPGKNEPVAKVGEDVVPVPEEAMAADSDAEAAESQTDSADLAPPDTEIETDGGALAQESEVDIDLTEELGAPDVAEEARIDERTKPPTLRQIREMIATGKYDEAVQGLRLLRRESPQNALYPYMQAEIFFDRKWYKDAFAHYREAIRLNPTLRGKKAMNKNLISLLGTDKAYKKARWILIKDIGRPALPYLKRAARTHSDRLVKRRAKNIADVITDSR